MINIEAIVPENLALFQLATADSLSSNSLILVAKSFAEFGPFLALAIAGYVFFADRAGRHAAAFAGMALVVGLAINFGFASLLYEPRPFEMGLGQNLLHHVPETSFPSDHATFIWSLGFALLLFDRKRWPGALCVLLGGATAWARVYLGAHFPLDMAASLMIAVIAAIIVMLFRPALTRFLVPVADYSHDLFMQSLRAVWRKTAGR